MSKAKKNPSADAPEESLSLRVKVVAVILLFLMQSMTKTIAVRLLNMLLIAFGFANETIASLLQCSVRTVRDLRKKIQNADFADLKALLQIKKGSGRKRTVSDEMEIAIVKEVDQNNYSNLTQIVSAVKEIFHLDLSEKMISRILRKHNSKKRKVESYPAKADPEKQKQFFENTEKPLIDMSKKGIRKVLFMDGSHFVLSFKLIGSVYGTFRKIVKTFTGKKRYNVLGALDYASKELITISTFENINSLTVIELLKNIALKYYDSHITIVLDNARYQYCKAVLLAAEKLAIELVFLPPYSPNLNFIERVWKFAKNKLRMKYYDEFEDFTEAIDKIMDKINGEYAEEIESLVGEKVRLYEGLEKLSNGTYADVSRKSLENAA